MSTTPGPIAPEPTAPPPTSRRPSRWTRGARFRSHDGGATAVEFGIVALPFLFGLMAIFEVALTFLSGQTLQMAVDNVSRQVRTGEFHASAATSKTDFINAICSEAILLYDCPTRLRVDIREFPQFQDIERLPILDDQDDFKDSAMNFEVGGADSIIVARAFYKRKPIAPMFTDSASHLQDGSILMSAALIFQNEPFE